MTAFAKDSPNPANAYAASRESYTCAGCGVREGIHESLPLSPVTVNSAGLPIYTGEHLCPLCVAKMISLNRILNLVSAHGEPVLVEKGTLFPFSPSPFRREAISSEVRRILARRQEEAKLHAREEMKGPETENPRLNRIHIDETSLPIPDPRHDVRKDEATIGDKHRQRAQYAVEEAAFHPIKNLPYNDAELWQGEKKEIQGFLKAFEETYGYNRDFAQLLNRMARTHMRKNRDYATDDNRYSNFEYAARISEVFTDPVDRVFATMIGIKLARMSELKKGKSPNFESLSDSHLDASVYSVLWASYNRMKERENEEQAGDPSPKG